MNWSHERKLKPMMGTRVNVKGIVFVRDGTKAKKIKKATQPCANLA